MTTPELLVAGQTALSEGRWAEARDVFEASVAEEETGDACFGLAAALWWLGESQGSVDRCTHAYALYRRAAAVPGCSQVLYG